MDSARNIIFVMSGKGGVGKTTVSAFLAYSLVAKGFRVALLDVDLCGPSIPTIFGLQNKKLIQSEFGWEPVYWDENKLLAVVSLAFLLQSETTPVIWKGPRKVAMIRQLIHNVNWGEVDFLILDTPPGTSDEHISLAQFLSPDGVILVTTPQSVSIADVRREIAFCNDTKLPILGIVENMSGYRCPHCQEITNIFARDGGKNLANKFELDLLGVLPIEPSLGDFFSGSCEDISKKFINSLVYQPFHSLVETVLAKFDLSQKTTCP